jgi:hypothetical protein
MLWVFADHHHFSAAFDDLAFFTNRFYRASDFHFFSLLQAYPLSARLDQAPRPDAASGKLIYHAM